MLIKNTSILFFISLIILSCSDSNQTANDSDVTSVANILQELIKNDNNGDLEGVMSHYAADAILMSPNSPSIQGYQNIENHYRTLFENSEFLGLRAIPNEIRVQGNLATIAGVNYGTIQSKMDSTKVKIYSKFLMQFIKQKGEWKVSRLIWNNAGSDENIFNSK